MADPNLHLREDQLEDLSLLIGNPKFGLLNDPGTGKTPTVCVYSWYLWKNLGIKTLWPQPKGLMRKNRMELLRWTDFKDEEIVVIDGSKRERERQILNPFGKVFLMGFSRFADDWKMMKMAHPQAQAVFVDEYHMGFKTPTSKRTQSLLEAFNPNRPSFSHFVPMSGTLIAGRLDNAYSAIKIIEPRYYANHFDFLRQHAIMDGWGNVVGWTNHEKLGRIFQNHFSRRSFESVYGDQSPIIVPDVGDMAPKQLAAYREFEENALLELEEAFLTGSSGGVFALRCRQICAHPHTFGLMKEGELTGKDELLMVHLEDHKNTDEPLLIYAALVPEQERIAKICREAGFRVGLINGTVDMTTRDEIDVKFQKGELDIVVGSPATMAVGYNWGHVNHVIFASIDYQDDNFVQAYKRAIRGVRKRPLLIHVLEYRNSVDQIIFNIVNHKSQHLHKIDKSYGTLSLGEKMAAMKAEREELDKPPVIDSSGF